MAYKPDYGLKFLQNGIIVWSKYSFSSICAL